jgi:PhoPQ-activated pathogenicity-related protein
LEAFYNAFVRDVDMPKFSWVVKSANQIVMTTQTPPKTVKLWQATNPKGRDFRLETIGEKWVGTTLAPDPADATRYVANVAAPTNGWTAFFIQMTYPGPDANLPDADFGFSTQVVVTPDTYPSSAK